jgi:hypothetical protein
MCFDPQMEISKPADWEAAQDVFDDFHDSVVGQSFSSTATGSTQTGTWCGQVTTRSFERLFERRSRRRNRFHGVFSVTFESQEDVQPGEATTVRTREGDFLRFRFSSCEVIARAATVTP